VSGVTTAFVGNWFEWDGTAGAKYYYAGGQRVAMRLASGSLRWIVTDHLGSTSKVTDVDGNPLSTTLYKPWGEVRYQSGTTPTKYRFTGQYQETALGGAEGLYYYGARWYDPYLNRFIQPDTIIPEPGNPMAYDRFAYALNNPLKYTDPTGHWIDPPCSRTGTCDQPSFAIDYSDLGLGRVGNALAMTVIEIIATPVCVAYVGCHVNWGENTITGPTYEEAANAQVMGLGTPIAIVSSPWAPELGNIFQNFKPGRAFRTNLQRLTGMSDEAVDGLQAHHVLPQTLESRFSKLGLGINIHDPHFGAWVGPEHQKWTTAYQNEWEAWLDSFVDRTPTLDELFEQAARMAKDYGFEWTPPGSKK
jgi:RHS repeat-associated protein